MAGQSKFMISYDEFITDKNSGNRKYKKTTPSRASEEEDVEVYLISKNALAIKPTITKPAPKRRGRPPKTHQNAEPRTDNNGLGFNSWAKTPILTEILFPLMKECEERGIMIRIFIIDNPRFTNTRDILMKFPNVMVDAINYPHNGKDEFNETIPKDEMPEESTKPFSVDIEGRSRCYRCMSKTFFDSIADENREYNIIYYDCMQTLRKSLDVYSMMERHVSRKLCHGIFVHSTRKECWTSEEHNKEWNSLAFELGFKFDLELEDPYKNKVLKGSLGGKNSNNMYLKKVKFDTKF